MKHFFIGFGLVLLIAIMLGCAAVGEAFLQTGLILQCGPTPMGPSDCEGTK